MQSHILFRELLSQLQTGWAGLPDKPEETPQTTLMALLRSTGALQQDDHSGEFSSNVEQSLRILVEQRLDGVPLAYLTGRQVFMEIEFLSSPEAMIPRKETEILGKAALGLARQLSVGRKLVRVIAGSPWEWATYPGTSGARPGRSVPGLVAPAGSGQRCVLRAPVRSPRPARSPASP